MVSLPVDALTDAERAVIDRIIGAKQAWVPVREFAEEDAAILAELCDPERGWLVLWPEWTPDARERLPSVTLTPWGAERLRVKVREHRGASLVCEEREGPGGNLLRIARPAIVDDLPYWIDADKPERSLIAPRHARELHMSVPSLENCLWRMTRYEVVDDAPKVMGVKVREDRRLA